MNIIVARLCIKTMALLLCLNHALPSHAQSFQDQVSVKIQKLKISANDFEKIISYVSNNEFGSSPDGIVSWNEGEAFASIGIGHFIWYPENVPQKFEESFPKMARHLASEWNFQNLSPAEISLFNWAKNFIYLSNMAVRFCPWATRSEFFAWKQHSPSQFRDLVKFFSHPKIKFIQAQYLDADFRVSLVEVADSVDSRDDLNSMEAPSSAQIAAVKKKIEIHILSMLESKLGYTALLDYINFKGDGIDTRMRYHGVGWGLQQVMFNMSAQGTSQTQILKNFALATLNRMVRRSQLAANSIERTQWIHGWANRILGYGFTDFDSEIKAMATEENADGTLKWPKLGIGNKALRNLF